MNTQTKKLIQINGIEGLIDPSEFLRSIERCEYEDSLYHFLQGAWPYIATGPFSGGWHIEAVCEHLEAVCYGDIKRLIINIPPRCSKSSVFSVAFPAWVWAQDPRFDSPTSGASTQFLFASYAQNLALRDSVKCRRLIESPFYQNYWNSRFRLTADQNTKTRFDNSKGGSRLSTSVGSALTGEGGNIIGVDDPNNAQDANSQAIIEATLEWWDSALSTRLNDQKNGAFVVIQQRLSEQDLTGHITSKSRGEWSHLMIPMRYEPDRSFVTAIGWKDPRTEPGELMAPGRFGEEEVAALEKSLGPWAAAGQLQQRPEPRGGGIIKREWWRLWDKDNFPACDYIIASIDTAYTTKAENDYSAMTVWGVFGGGEGLAYETKAYDENGLLTSSRSYSQEHPKVVLMYAWKERLELHDLVDKVNQTMKLIRADLLLIENKASGISVSQEMQRLFGREDYGVRLIDPKGQDKMARLYSVQHLFAEGLIYAPDRSWADMVITEVGTFPKGRYDDLVDSTTMALKYLRETGLIIRGPEHTANLIEKSQVKQQLKPLYPV